MIKIDKQDADRPLLTFRSGKRKGLDKLIEGRRELIERYLKYKDDIHANKKKFKFKNDLYAHPILKSKLKALQHNKCCFCEAKVTHIAHGDVEHFRPKAAYKQTAQEAYQYPGYFWLAYDWDNLFFSCQLCNQRHKKNLFPLVDPTTRMLDYDGDISIEETLFVDPAKDDPEEHIVFIDEVPRHVYGSKRGEETIKSLGLNRLELNEDRKEQLQMFLTLLTIIELYPNEPALKPHHDAAKELIRTTIYNKMKPESEYSLMFKSLYYQRIKLILEDENA